MPAYELTVQQDFGAYKKGDAIWEADAMKAVLESENALRVIKVAAGTHSGAAKAPEASEPASVDAGAVA